nr:LLM class flavin-dependent oxidoreductase [Acuticoccus mangrovi]
MLNSFASFSVSHNHQGLWQHPRDQSLDYWRLETWTTLAELLERGLFDGLFIADGLGVFDVYGGGPEATIEHAVNFPKNDPATIVSAMAAVTRHLGFGITFNVIEELPYAFARRISTLDHLTHGRIAWNIVTGYLDSAAKARGIAKLMPREQRYAIADEFCELTYKLWEASWEEDAVLRDKARGVFADPKKVHRIVHEGEFFSLDAVHYCEPSPQRTPVLFQAGTSPSGVDFAGKHAECVFVNGPSTENVGGRVRRLRQAVADAGRDPRSLKVFASLTPIAAATDAEAFDKHAEYSSYIDSVGSLARLSAFIGQDLSTLDPDASISGIESNSIQSILENLTANGGRKVRDAANSLNPNGVQPMVVGSGATVAEEMIRWVEEADVDGFNLVQTVKPEGVEDFVTHVVPELQSRGAYKTAYAEGTLREKMFGAGAYTPDDHPSAKLRRAANAGPSAVAQPAADVNA